MHLWTYQHPAVLAALEKKQVVRGSWDRVEPRWRPAYQRVVRELNRRGLQTDDLPPIWAWHSWEAWAEGQNDAAGVALLSDAERARGVVRLVLDVPDRVALLTWYSPWNSLIEPLGPEDEPEELWRALMPVAPPALGQDLEDAVQAALPRLEPQWVKYAARVL